MPPATPRWRCSKTKHGRVPNCRAVARVEPARRNRLDETRPATLEQVILEGFFARTGIADIAAEGAAGGLAGIRAALFSLIFARHGTPGSQGKAPTSRSTPRTLRSPFPPPLTRPRSGWPAASRGRGRKSCSRRKKTKSASRKASPPRDRLKLGGGIGFGSLLTWGME